MVRIVKQHKTFLFRVLLILYRVLAASGTRRFRLSQTTSKKQRSFDNGNHTGALLVSMKRLIACGKQASNHKILRERRMTRRVTCSRPSTHKWVETAV
jgi:hypothetical protein